MLTLAVKCESCLCCAAHNINKSVPNGLPPLFPSPLPVHILAGHEIKFAPESMQRKRRHSCRRCAKVANHQVLPSPFPPLSPYLSLCLPLAAGLQLIMSKLAITATLARRSLGRRCYAWLPKYFRAAKLIYKFPLELCPVRSVARSRCHMLWVRGVSTWRI